MKQSELPIWVILSHVTWGWMRTWKMIWELLKNIFVLPGVYRVNCNINNQTVTVSGNVPPEDLLRRVRWIKSHSQILSYNNNNDYRGGSSFGSGSDYRYNNNPYANERYPTSPSFGGSDYNGYPSYIDNDSRYGSSYGSSYGGLERSYSSAYGYY